MLAEPLVAAVDAWTKSGQITESMWKEKQPRKKI